jgi:hypothetical protein
VFVLAWAEEDGNKKIRTKKLLKTFPKVPNHKRRRVHQEHHHYYHHLLVRPFVGHWSVVAAVAPQ